MTATPQVKVAGDDWTFTVQFLDSNMNPLPLPAGMTPFADLYVGTINQTSSLTINIANPAIGICTIAVPRSLTGGILPQDPPYWFQNNYPIRLRGGIVDTAMRKQTCFVEPVSVVDWRSADLANLPPSDVLFALAGPAGPVGATGATGATGPTSTQSDMTAYLASLPTTLPTTTGKPWNNGGVIQVS